MKQVQVKKIMKQYGLVRVSPDVLNEILNMTNALKDQIFENLDYILRIKDKKTATVKELQLVCENLNIPFITQAQYIYLPIAPLKRDLKTKGVTRSSDDLIKHVIYILQEYIASIAVKLEYILRIKEKKTATLIELRQIEL